MNVDFRLKLSGKVARKIKFMQSIINVHVDPIIYDYINHDILTDDYLSNTVPAHLWFGDYSTARDRIQFFSDCDWRGVIGCETRVELLQQMLQITHATDKQIVICMMSEQEADLHYLMENLKILNIPYALLGENSNHTNDHIILSLPATNHLLSKHRDRVLMHFTKHNRMSFVLSDLFGSERHVSLYEICREFKHIVFGFYLSLTPENTKVQWCHSDGVSHLIDSINIDSTLSKCIGYNPKYQENLLNYGFMLRSPYHIGKLLNVYTESIRHYYNQSSSDSE